MKAMNISFSPPDMSDMEIQEVADTIKSGWITTGPKTKELERQIAKYVGVNRCVCLNSQTACGEMALRVLMRLSFQLIPILHLPLLSTMWAQRLCL